ncbi:MAG: hypothetical protein Q9216_007093 [Gyalolechia sp. 2 TL-2023]
MNDDYGDPPVGHIETMAEDYVLLDTTERTAPNGKPAGIDPPKDESPLDEWEARRTPKGEIYYVNHTTRTTQWTRPKNFNTDISSKDIEDGPLPEGWEQGDQLGRPYYIDHNTRTTSWVRPNPNNEDTSRPLPPCWERRWTEDGSLRLYFVNHNDKTTSWEFPKHPVKELKEVTGTRIHNKESMQATYQGFKAQYNSEQRPRERLLDEETNNE